MSISQLAGNFSFATAGSPLLKNILTKNIKQVDDPHGVTVYDQMVKANKKFVYEPLGSGSDYASFYQFVGKCG